MHTRLRDDETVLQETEPEPRSNAWWLTRVGPAVAVLSLTVLLGRFVTFIWSIPGPDPGTLYGVEFAGMVLGLGMFAVGQAMVRGLRFYITDQRIITEFSFIIRRTVIVPYDRITNTSQRQGIFDRLFGTGSVIIDTAGSTWHEAVIRWVADHQAVEHAITERSGTVSGSSADILDRRFAAGEMDEEEYRRKKRLISEGS